MTTTVDDSWVAAISETARLASVQGQSHRGQELLTLLEGVSRQIRRVSEASDTHRKLLVIDPTGMADAVAMLAGIASSVVRIGHAGATERTAADVRQWVPNLIISRDPGEPGPRFVTADKLLRFDDTEAGSGEPPPSGRIELRTSGTTGEPKLVPLQWNQLVSSARSVAHSLDLAPNDVTLAVMPLGHVHGLVASLLAPLVSGGTTICTPGFDAAAVSRWIDENRVTWVSAVPTMLRQMLTVSEQTGWLPNRPLRFLRSASSALPVSLLQQLEDRFQCPVVEAYGMTEAAHQICSAAPTDRKRGSVGRAAGVDVRVVDPARHPLLSGQSGEVEIRGDSVMAGYVGQDRRGPDEWLATGDLGWMDPTGRLFLQGRRKEIINRGGETIAPRDVDDALSRINGVVDAISFSVPDSLLGEIVGAVVVLDETAPTERMIRHLMLSWVDHRHVPIALVAVEAIPTGKTGKPDRDGARELWIAEQVRREAEWIPVEVEPELLGAVRRAWRTVLGMVCADDVSFMAAGGDSLRALELETRFSDAGLMLTIVDMASAQTIDAQARLAAALQAAGTD